MSGHPRSGGVPIELLRERERRAWELSSKMWTQERIAQELGLERSTISKMLKRLNERAMKTITDEILAEKAQHIRQLKEIADEAFQAWERSKETRKGVVKKSRTGGMTRGEETTTSVQDQDGDPRYLETAMKALNDIRKILGLDAPEKIERVLNPEEERLASLTDEERAARIAAILDKARARGA